MKFLISIFLILSTQEAFSWGGRGHHAICSAAPHLLKNSALKDFMKLRGHTMGHLCNIPDIYWRSLGHKANEYGSPAHFIDPEIIGLKISEIPLNYKEIQEKYTGSPNKLKNGKVILSVPKELGSLWWRANQFFETILNLKNSFVAISAAKDFPKNSKEEQDENHPYNSAVYKMMTSMGLMGHFVGDASQPYHASADYDGYLSGHGGIHGYYEETVVGQFDEGLEKEIVKAAKKMKIKSFLDGGSTLQKMQKLSQISLAELELIQKLDPLIQKSTLKNEKGMEIKTVAVRKPAKEGFKVFKEMMVQQMARSALLLAHLWDRSYEDSGAIDLSFYRSYRYPLTVEYVEVDYTNPIHTN